jgi:hypothetical protein
MKSDISEMVGKCSFSFVANDNKFGGGHQFVRWQPKSDKQTSFRFPRGRKDAIFEGKRAKKVSHHRG